MDEVLAANAAFYAAFARRDFAAMEAVWASEGPVACIHPGWDALEGREAVLRSWRDIFRAGGAPPGIRCERPVAHVHGDAAFVICLERVPGGVLIATNVFARVAGQWRMTHHHSSPVPTPEPPEEMPN